jgi:hypothetical protein
MPGFVKTPKDEKKWSEAKEAAGKSGGEPKWALANFIFHRMKKSQGLEKAEEFMQEIFKSEAQILSPKPTPTAVANPMKSGEQSTISKTPKSPGMFKSEDFKDVKHASARKLRDFMAKCKS